MANELLAILAIIPIFAIPGIALSFATLKGVKLNLIDKILIGLLLGILVNPFLSFLEFALFRIEFSASLVLINSFMILIFALVLMFFNAQVQAGVKSSRKLFKRDFYAKLIEEKPVAAAVYAFLLILMLSAFYVRFASAWSSSFFEFDPYYYDKVTEQLVLHGDMPLKSDYSFYPRWRSFRELPMVHYMTGSWYALFKDFTGVSYSQEQLVLIIQFYPPLAGLFLVFLAYLFIREESNKYIGLIAAALFALTPQLVKKMGAGVSEQAPFGMFATMLVFAFYAMAINRKDYRLGALAAFAMMIAQLGSGHFIWPYMILALFIFIISILEYVSGTFEKKDFVINIMVTIGALAANILLVLYREQAFTLSSIFLGVQMLIAVLLPSVAFYLIGKVGFDKKFTRAQILGSLFLLLLIVFIVTPLGSTALGYGNSLLRAAKVDNPLNRTIQEEGATSEGLFGPSFGVLNPNQLLIAAMVLLVGLAMLSLRKKGYMYSIGFGIAAFVLVALNKYVDMVLTAFSSVFGSIVPEVAILFQFIIESDVFIYFLISLCSLIVYYHYEEKKSKMTLLFLLAFYPTAYIGLNKVKYLLHLAFALALALPFVLMMLSEFIEKFNKSFKLIANENTLKTGILVMVILFGAMVIYKQYETVPQSMAELQFSRISSDWLASTNWMRDNLGENYRVISWWDYGHWTTFLGGTKSVLDPSNYFSDYDQLTAQSFVGGNTSLLIDVMHYHNATHILVDSELVQKWGALVYLSGTFSGLSKTQPGYEARFDREPSIPSSASPGSSEYETEHYFEYLYSMLDLKPDGQYAIKSCPGIIPRTMLYSSFGAIYCIDSNGNLFMIGNAGEEKKLSTAASDLIYTGDNSIAPGQLQAGVYFNTRYSFINLNPDLNSLTSGKLNSKLKDSAFVNLFFKKQLPGFSLAYESPNGQVKIFKLIA